MEKQKILIVVLAITLIFVLNYFLLDSFFKQNQKQIEEAYISGLDQGVNNTITVLFNQTKNCNVITLFIENSSKKLVDADCLNLDNSLTP